MTTDIDIIITDLTGYNFIINLNWDIDIMKQSICTHYEIKLFNEFLTINNISNYEYYKNTDHTYKWLKSSLHAKADNYYFVNIELIYNDKILEQCDVESDLITEEMIKENNNMSFVIVKKETINLKDLDDRDSINYEAFDDWDVDED